MTPDQRATGLGGCVTLGLLLTLFGGLAAWLVPLFIPAKRGVRFDERARVSLHLIHGAEELFARADKDEDGLFDYGTLEELSHAGLIDDGLGSGTRSYYRFDVLVSSTHPERWMAVANPQLPGLRSFVTNQAGGVWAVEGRALACFDPCLIPRDAVRVR